MSIISCILAKAALGKVTKTDAERIKAHVESLQEQRRATGEVPSELEAAQKALEDGTFILQQKQQKIANQLKFQKSWEAHAKAQADLGFDDVETIKALFYETPHTKYSYKQGVSENVMPSIEAYRAQSYQKYAAKVHDAAVALKRNTVTGSIDSSLEREIFNEIWALEREGVSKTTNKAAKEVAAKINDLAIFANKEYKRLGGSIRGERDFLLGAFADPHNLRVRASKNPDFKNEFIRDLESFGVDVAHFNNTLQTNIQGQAQLRQALDDIYKAMVSGSPLDPTGSYIPAAIKHVATAHNLPRALRFTSKEGTMAFMKKYGQGTLGDLLQNYIGLRSVEDSVMAAFGGNASAIRKMVLASARDKSPEKVKELGTLFDRYASHSGVRGANKALDDYHLNYAIANLKSIASANLLGKVGLWQATIDMWNLPLLSNHMKGLPIIKNIQSSYKALIQSSGRSEAAMKDLAKLGYVNENWYSGFLNKTITAADQELTNPYWAKGAAGASNAIRTISGSTKAINATVRGEIEFLVTHLSDVVESGNLNSKGEGFGNWLKSYGFDESTLKFIQENAMSDFSYSGKTFKAIDKAHLDAIDSDQARKASLALTRVMNDHVTAVNPTMPGYMKAAVDEWRGGGFGGRALAEGSSYLSGYLTGHWNNMTYMANTMPNKAAKFQAYSQYVVMAAISGYMSTVIADLLAGKDAPPMSEDILGRVVGRAIGPIGDALVSAGDSMGGGGLAALVPGLNYAMQLGETGVKGVKHAATGKFDKLPADVVQFLNKTLPGQSVPVVGLLMRRYIMDQILAQLDPEAFSKFHASANTLRSRTGQEFFWKPGEIQPNRSPDLSHLLDLHIKN